MIKQITKFMGIAALIFTMYACSDDDEVIHEIEPGTFEATITGDIDKDIEGAAVFIDYFDQSTGERAFVLGFGSSVEETMNIWLFRAGEYPGDGSYEIQPTDFEDMEQEDWFMDIQEFVGYSERLFNEQIELFLIESGAVSLELTGDNTVTGEFEIIATGFLMNQEGIAEESSQIQITGRYNSVPGQ